MVSEPTNSNAVKQHIQGIFDRAAPSYDQVGARFFTYFGHRLVEAANLSPGTNVLDVATSRGAVLFPAAEALSEQGQVVGIDISSGMIDATRADVAARGVANVALQQMDAETLRFPDETFDAVICGFALFMMPQLDQALAEMRRVLRVDGRICVSAWMETFGPEFTWLEPLQAQFLQVAQSLSRTNNGAKPVFHTSQGLTAILSTASFTNVTTIEHTERFFYADEEDWWASMWSHGMRSWLEAVERQQGPAALQRFKEAAYAQLREVRLPEGIP